MSKPTLSRRQGRYSYALLMKDGKWHTMPLRTDYLTSLEYRCEQMKRSYRLFLHSEMFTEVLK